MCALRLTTRSSWGDGTGDSRFGSITVISQKIGNSWTIFEKVGNKTRIVKEGLTEDVAVRTAREFNKLAEGAKKAAEVEGHHLATNKNWISALRGGPWSPRFAKIFKRAGMTLEDAENIVRLPGHAGPHSEAYHKFIYRALDEATSGLEGQAAKDALIAKLKELAIEAATPGTLLYKLLMG